MNEQIKLTEEQIDNLARPIVKMLDKIEDFFKNPQNEQAYQNWYFKKYGCYPEEVKR